MSKIGFTKQYSLTADYEVPKKIPWYYAPIFAAFWLILYFSVVVTQIDHLPDSLALTDEKAQPTAFIGERATTTQFQLANIGPKVVGSIANEYTVIEFLKSEIEKIRASKSDSFEIDMDVQLASGNYIHWTMINMYQSIQNVVVRLSAKGSTNDNYLLINSHFDSARCSPGAGDDGSMVSVMLEVLRVIAISNGTLKHPIIFLFNGAEENPLQASHAFITQHKWAKNCKALINLDAAGSGGRELLFQSGPNNPWLMEYYRKVPHPFATTVAEEIFQANLIPSDTDFRIFRDFGHVPGLDMAYTFDGYVYHTKYDGVDVFPKKSFQNTGENILTLAKAIANGPELDNTTLYEDGHVIFFDFLGWFIILYTQTVGIVINIVVCLIATLAIGTSLYFMSVRSGLNWYEIFKRYGIFIIIQLLSLALGFGLVVLIAVLLDSIDFTMSWYSENYLIIGLYFCPMFFGMGILPSLYIQWKKEDVLSLGFRIQLVMHSHCLFLILITIILTGFQIRSAFMPMMAVFFDILALIINLLTKFHRRAYWFAIMTIICQILPFLYYTSIAQTFYYTLIPMMGRIGSAINPDLYMGGIAVIMSVHFAGFIMPIFLFFRKTRTIICCFFGVTLLFFILALTPAGFPFKEKTASQRYSMLHAQRILHNADNTIRVTESGIYINPEDRHLNLVDECIEAIGEKHKVSEYCEREMLCGLPIYNHRWNKARESSFWIPFNEPPTIPSNYPKLIQKSVKDTGNTRHFEFSLSGPDHMSIFVGPIEGAKIVAWSFNDTMIRDNWEPPFFIYFSYGKDDTPLEFSINIEKSNTSSTSTLEIGVSGHWTHQDKNRTPKYQKFVESFPNYAFIDDWIATYESWIF